MTTKNIENNFQGFYTITSVVFGALAGLLIALPISLSQPNPGSGHIGLITVILLTTLGAIMGYKKRQSRVFFYLCIITILVISSLLSAVMMKLG